MLTLHHAPMSRSESILWLLEELAVPYRTELVDIRADGGPPDGYRRIQPHKKVPAVVHDGVTITERAAIATYLCDAFPEAGLAPPIGDPRRASYLTWLVYTDAVVDSSMVAKANRWDNVKASAFGLFDDMVANIERTLGAHPYIAGERFTAADTQLGTALRWGLDHMKIFPELPVFRSYLARIQARPGYERFLAAARARP
jgi:glutathione S-transferase